MGQVSCIRPPILVSGDAAAKSGTVHLLPKSYDGRSGAFGISSVSFQSTDGLGDLDTFARRVRVHMVAADTAENAAGTPGPDITSLRWRLIDDIAAGVSIYFDSPWPIPMGPAADEPAVLWYSVGAQPGGTDWSLLVQVAKRLDVRQALPMGGGRG